VSLQHCLSASIRETLDQLPETLDETYARVLSQIPPGNGAHAHRMLQCLMVAVRTLRVEELAELLAFDFGTAQGAVPKYRVDWRPNDQVEAMLSTCSSLIAVVNNHGSQVVQFSHFSIKEFLMSDQLTSSFGNFSQYQINPRPAHLILAQACLGFLLHLDGHNNEEIVKSFPLAKYAAKHWVTHAQFEDVASSVKEGMESLFEWDKPHFVAWVGIHNIDEESNLESPSKTPTPLYYSSLCGFSELVEHLAKKHPQHVNAIGGKYNFPLIAALVGTHKRVVEILLEHGANVNIRGMQEQSPLHEAIQDKNQNSALHFAAFKGRLDIAKVLLSLYFQNPPFIFCILGLQMLLDHGTSMDTENDQGQTPLHMVSLGAHDSQEDGVSIIQLLLEHGVNINSQDKVQNTTLHWAAFKGRLQIAGVLLSLCFQNPPFIFWDYRCFLTMAQAQTWRMS
jgi:ankyrin repeat protein